MKLLRLANKDVERYGAVTMVHGVFVGYEGQDTDINPVVIETVGVATCDKEDEYDAAVGERIALGKARAKALIKYKKILELAYREFSINKQNIGDLLSKVSQTVDYNSQYYFKKIADKDVDAFVDQLRAAKGKASK